MLTKEQILRLGRPASANHQYNMNLPQTAIITLIDFYQHTLSPDHGWLRGRFPYGFCRFYPSCSEYAKQAVARHGAVRGSWLALRRLGRCNPWTQPAVEPVPEATVK